MIHWVRNQRFSDDFRMNRSVQLNDQMAVHKFAKTFAVLKQFKIYYLKVTSTKTKEKQNKTLIESLLLCSAMVCATLLSLFFST